MTPPASPPDIIGDEEPLARYIFFKSHVRADGTVKQDAFIPHPHPDLSVTRHICLTDEQIWTHGKTVSVLRKLALIGRADRIAQDYRDQKLLLSAAPVHGNLNHANITGWPADKPAQKIIAQLIAIRAGARYLPTPTA